jgi:hypothetical protein
MPAVRRCIAACRRQIPAPADGRKRSRHQASPATTIANCKPSQTPTIGPVTSATPVAAPATQPRHLQPGRQRSRSCSRRRR